jgi:hypothetical protein
MCLSAEKFWMQSKENKKIEKIPSGRKTLYNQPGGSPGPKEMFGLRCDASMCKEKDEKQMTKMSLSLCSKAASN